MGRQGPGAWVGDLKICDKCLWIRTEGAERLTWTSMCWLEPQLYVNWRAIWPFHQRQGEWLLADVNQIHGFLRSADAVFSIATLKSKLGIQNFTSCLERASLLLPEAGIFVNQGRPFSVNTLNVILTRSLWGPSSNVLTILDFKQTNLFLVTFFRIKLDKTCRQLKLVLVNELHFYLVWLRV